MKVKGKNTLDLYFSMSSREAEALMTIMSHVGGSPDGPRGVTYDITKALSDMGVRPRSASGTITFANTWERFSALPRD